MPSQNEPEIASLLRETLELTRENNRLLKRMHRNGIIEMWLRLLWYAFLIGLPFALYFYILEPYFGTFQDSLKQLQVGSSGPFPGLDMLESYLEGKQIPR